MKSSLTVLQVLPSLNQSGGVERGTIDIAKGLIQQGHQALVACAGGAQVKTLQDMGAHVLTYPPLKSKTPWNLVRSIAWLIRVIRTYAVDCVHARSRFPAWASYLSCRYLATPFVTTYHAPYSGCNRTIKRFYNSVMARGDYVIAISSFVHAHIKYCYQNTRWFQPNKLVTIPRGVDMDFFTPHRIQESAQNLKERYHLPAHGTLFVLPGRWTRWKGQEFILRLWDQTPQQAHLVLWGDGPESYVQEIKRLIAQQSCAQRIHVVHETSQILHAYAIGDYVLVPSQEPEGFGRTMAEAGAMHLPVIASDHGGAQEIIETGTTGWLVPPHAPLTWINAIAHAMDAPQETRHLMGQQARARVQQYFSLDNFVQDTIDLYIRAVTTFKR